MAGVSEVGKDSIGAAEANPVNQAHVEHDKKAEQAARSIRGDVDMARVGLKLASEQALAEVHKVLRDGLMKDTAKALEENSTVQVLRDKEGNPTHLLFDARFGSRAIDIDVKAETLNNKSIEELHKDAVSQAKEYSHAEFDDPRIRTEYDREITPQGRSLGKALKDAMFDGDKDAVGKIAKEILRDPDATAAAADALNAVDMHTNVMIIRDQKGRQYIKLDSLDGDLAVDKDGKFQKVSPNADGSGWRFSEAKDVDRDMNETAKMALGKLSLSLAQDIYHRPI